MLGTTIDVDAAAEVLRRARANATRPRFDVATFSNELSRSPLQPGARQTMSFSATHSDSRGIFREPNRAIAEALGCRPNTVSDHWDKARTAGFLTTRRRYNAASVQRLTWPTGDQSTPDLIDAESRPLRAAEWSHTEREWFANLDPSKPALCPWEDREPPF